MDHWQGCYFEEAHLGLDSHQGCVTEECNVLHNMRDVDIEGGVNLSGRIYQRTSLVTALNCDQSHYNCYSNQER